MNRCARQFGSGSAETLARSPLRGRRVSVYSRLLAEVGLGGKSEQFDPG